MKPRGDLRVTHRRMGYRLQHFFRWRATVCEITESVEEQWAVAGNEVLQPVHENVPTALGVGEWTQKAAGQVTSVATMVDTAVLLGDLAIKAGAVLVIADPKELASELVGTQYEVTGVNRDPEQNWTVCSVRARQELADV